MSSYHIGNLAHQEELLRSQLEAINARASLAHQPLVDVNACVARLYKRVMNHFGQPQRARYLKKGFNKSAENSRRLRQMQRNGG